MGHPRLPCRRRGGAHRCTAAVPGFFLPFLIILLLVPAVGGLAAQDTAEEPTGLLVRGPFRARGLPFIAANSIPHYRGLYETAGGELTVYYVEKEIVSRESWQEYRCGETQLQRFTVGGEEGTNYPVAYYEGGQYQLFFRFPENGLDCGFLETFLSRFRYFRSLPGEEKGSAPPFPAVLGL